MVLLFFGFGALTLGGIALGRRGVQQPATPPPVGQGGAPSSSSPSDGARAEAPPQRPPVGRPLPGGTKDDKGLGELGEAGVVGALGAALGTLASVGAQDTKEARLAAPAIGAGVALAAYMANVGGVAAASGLSATLGAFSVIAWPILEITYAIVVIVDQIIRQAKAQQWREMAQKIRELREKGQFREALAVFQKAAPEIEPLSRVWPKPDEAWYNPNDELGRPYPGFPGPPKGATAADVKRWPSLVPEKVTLEGPGGAVDYSLSALLDAAYADAAAARDALLQQSAAGYDLAGKLVTTGDRDVRHLEPYQSTLKLAHDWARKLSACGPWLLDWQFIRVPQLDDKGEPVKDVGGVVQTTEVLTLDGAESNALVRDIRTAIEVGRDAAAVKAFNAKEAAEQATALARVRAAESGLQATKKGTRVASPTGRPLPPPVFRTQMQAAATGETATERRTGSSDRENSTTGGGERGTTSGRGAQRNNSGSGGRNA